jgi:hypothetical protein
MRSDTTWMTAPPLVNTTPARRSPSWPLAHGAEDAGHAESRASRVHSYFLSFSGMTMSLTSAGCSTTARMRVLPSLLGFFETPRTARTTRRRPNSGYLGSRRPRISPPWCTSLACVSSLRAQRRCSLGARRTASTSLPGPRSGACRVFSCASWSRPPCFGIISRGQFPWFSGAPGDRLTFAQGKLTLSTSLGSLQPLLTP